MKTEAKLGGASRFPWKIFARIQLFQAFLLVAALLASAFVARHYFKKFFIAQVEHQLRDTLKLIVTQESGASAKLGIRWCDERALGTDIRFTLIDLEGRVRCDSRGNALKMENHLRRPEVQGALVRGEGYAIRQSATTGENLIYGARLLPGGVGVVRAALSLAILRDALRAYDVSVALVLTLLALSLFFFAYWSNRQMMQPVFGEWKALEKSIDQMGESLSLEREELATLMAGISDGVLAVDFDGLPLFFNSRFALLLKLRGLREERPPYSQIFASAPTLIEAFRRALNEGRASSLEAVALGTGAEERRFFSVSISPLKRRTQHVYGAVGLFHDVTELKAAEQIRIDFVANVSHELRTPLTSIQGYAETLRDDLQAGRAADPHFLEIIGRNTDRLLSLIDDLLDISALESPAGTLRKESVSTAEVSARVLSQVNQKLVLRRQQVRVENEVSHIEADPRRLEQVLINLLDNAIKFSAEGSEIRVRWILAPGSAGVQLSVTDRGPGIAPEHQARLFERFYRIDKARSREMGGTGLGLAIVKHIMMGHRGSVQVKSRPGEGAVFSCHFPSDEVLS